MDPAVLFYMKYFNHESTANSSIKYGTTAIWQLMLEKTGIDTRSEAGLR